MVTKGVRITKGEKVSPAVSVLGRFFGVQSLKKKRLIKKSSKGFVLTPKGKRELIRKRKKFPFVAGGRV